MKIRLVDRNIEMCNQWNLQFKDCEDVEVYCDDFFDIQSDCIVSPSNSFGFMDGGLDNNIRKFYEKKGTDIYKTVQDVIYKDYFGELLVGQCFYLPLFSFTKIDKIPDLIVAPTMRVPMILGKESINVYLAMRAILLKLKELSNHSRVKSIKVSGLGTGVGQVPYDICAKQMKQAYDDVWLNKYKFPTDWSEAQIKHQLLYSDDYRDLQNEK
jgi:O-acetyl-ADP-ribose deacetylase (regulator of RNase III)